MRVRFILFVVALCALPRFQAGAQAPPDAKKVAEWTEALTQNSAGANGGALTPPRFAALDPDLQFAILRNALPKIRAESVFASLFSLVAQYADASGEYEPGQVKRLADNSNPRLLDILNLGISDKRPEMRQFPLDILNRDFGLKLTFKDYPDWYAKNGKRPVGDVMRDSITDLVAQLKTEKEGMRTYLLDRLRAMPLTSANWLLKEPEAKGLVAMRLTALRRKAAVDAGLLDFLATILRGGAANLDPNDKTTPGSSPVVRRKALALLSEFKSDAATLARIEPDVQREITARIGQPEDLQGISPALLFAFPGDWGLSAWNRWVEAEYLNYNFSETLQTLIKAREMRALPALFALLKEPETDYKPVIADGLREWPELDAPPGTAPAALLVWWETKPNTVPAVVFTEPLPHFLTPDQSLVKRLGDGVGYDSRAEERFAQRDADAQADFLRDHWKEIRSDTMRVSLLSNALRSVRPSDRDNPETFGLNGRLLELLDLGVNDLAPGNQKTALNTLAMLTGYFPKDAADYAAWRMAQTGKSNGAIFRSGCAALAKRLAEAKPSGLLGALGTAINLARFGQPSEGGSLVAARNLAAIAGVRRKTLNETGVTLQIVGLLNQTGDVRLQARSITYLNLVHPDAASLQLAEPTVRRLAEGELRRKDGFNPDLLAGVLLYDAPWATDALLNSLQKRYDDQIASLLLPIIRQKADPHLIPTLISLLDISEPNDWQYSELESTLIRLAKPVDKPRDIHAWVQWWEAHKADYPADVRALPYPRIGKIAAPSRIYSLLEETRLVRFKTPPQSAYYRIASGYLVTLPPAPQTAAYIPGGATAALTEEQKPGLLIILTNTAAQFDRQKQYWMQFDRLALKGRYVIALIVPPNAKSEKSLWTLRATTGAKSLPTAQELVAATIQDLLATIPLSQTRRYCVGVGEGGMAALACALAPSLGIRGVVADTAPFRSADLPPLANAKGKRIALLQDKSGHTLPEFVRTVARQTLAKAGAVLRVGDYDGKLAPVNAAPFDALGAAVAWLETGR